MSRATALGLALAMIAIPLLRAQERRVREDNINLPFVSDPEVIGGWRTVDFVKTPKHFVPDRPQRVEVPKEFSQFHFRPDGTTNFAFTWTRGFVLHEGDKTASHYVIQKRNDRSFLFLEWKTGDYIFRGQTPWWCVMERDDRLVETRSERRDRIDVPFVDDPAALGAWRSVDFVENPALFKPGQTAWKAELYLKGLEFLPGGKTRGPWSWTRGLLLHPGDRTAANYRIQEIKGTTYLFFEWKNGDYIFRNQTPKWYVLTR